MSKTNDRDKRGAIPSRTLESCAASQFAPYLAGYGLGNNSRGSTKHLGEHGMDLRVFLKVCEGCGCLWYRNQVESKVYCIRCSERLKDFPTVESRKRRGRPRKLDLPTVWAVADASGCAL